jgi:hypothetical protein
MSEGSELGDWGHCFSSSRQWQFTMNTFQELNKKDLFVYHLKYQDLADFTMIWTYT